MFTKVHFNRLNLLADKVSRARRFDMDRVRHACGTPACVGGHAIALFPALRRAYTNKKLAWFASIAKFLTGDTSGEEVDNFYREILSCVGCNSAGTDQHKAAAYLRGYAQRRFLETTLPASAATP